MKIEIIDDPESLISFGKAGVEATGLSQSGDAFVRLKCRKLYLWGDTSTPKQTQQFIEKHRLPNKCFAGSGHWPRIDAAFSFYSELAEFMNSTS